MARNTYQYGTSPRKLEPEYVPERKRQVKKKQVVKTKRVVKKENEKNKKSANSGKEKFKNIKQVSLILMVFTMLLAISYRNSLINEKFKEVKDLKNDLAVVKKENGQINKSIEENLNKENIEKIAIEELGMQKKTKNQTVKVTIEKTDYIETSNEDVSDYKEPNWFEKILNNIF